MADLYHDIFGQTTDALGHPIPLPSSAPPEGYTTKVFPESLATAPPAAMPQPLMFSDAQKEFKQYDDPGPWDLNRVLSTIVGLPFRGISALDAVAKNLTGTATPVDIAENARAYLDTDESTKATGRPASMLDTFMGTITGSGQRGMHAWNQIVTEQQQRAAAAKRGLEMNLGRQSLLKGSNELAGQGIDLGIKLETARDKARLEVANLRSTIDYRKVQMRAALQKMGLTEEQIKAAMDARFGREAFGQQFGTPSAAEGQPSFAETILPDSAVQREAVMTAPPAARGQFVDMINKANSEARLNEENRKNAIGAGGERASVVTGRDRALDYKELEAAAGETRLRERQGIETQAKTRADERKDIVEAYAKKSPNIANFFWPGKHYKNAQDILTEGQAVLKAYDEGKIDYLTAMKIQKDQLDLDKAPELPAATPVPDPYHLPFSRPSPGLVAPPTDAPTPLPEHKDDGGNLPRGAVEDARKHVAEAHKTPMQVFEEINKNSRQPITDPKKFQRNYNNWLVDPRGWPAVKERY